MILSNCFQNTRNMQYVAAIIATLSIPSGTMYTTWSSPALPKLTAGNSPIGEPITNEEGSWIASIQALGAIPGGIVTALILDRIPRKNFLLLCSIPLFFPWIVCIFANSAWMIVGAKFVGGIGAGFTQILVPLYVGEIADKDTRGKLGALFNILKLTGSLFVLGIGPFVSYTALTLICSAFPLIFFLLFCFMPESPYYLVKAGNYDAALKNFAKLSGNTKSSDSNFDEIVNTVTTDMQNKSTFWELISKKQYRKSFMIMLTIKTLQQFSGFNAIDAYMQTIIQSSGSSIGPEISSIICGFVQIPAVLLAGVLVDKVGRKPLWIISSLGCALALGAEGVYFYLHDVLRQNVDNISWLPTVALMFYLIMNPIGVFTLPYILMGELFATNIKDIAASVCILYAGALTFIFVKYFKPLADAWGMHTMFWIFCGGSILSAVIVYFILPETKGKTFLEIQAKINKTSKVDLTK